MSINEPPDPETDFGFQRIPLTEKARRVSKVFHQVADNYDVMNDLMSLGLHRVWKRYTVDLAAVRPGQYILDLAAGTGDLTRRLAKLVGATGQIVMADINAAMLARGRDRLIDAGILANIHYLQADAESLPFQDNTFDCITIAFGLRNVARKGQALSAMYRVLKPGGKVLILEFSKFTWEKLAPLYDLYSFKVLPALGRLIAKDAESYRYLAESIRMHPDQTSLLELMTTAGFENCDFQNLSGGIVALHRGYKY